MNKKAKVYGAIINSETKDVYNWDGVPIIKVINDILKLPDKKYCLGWEYAGDLSSEESNIYVYHSGTKQPFFNGTSAISEFFKIYGNPKILISEKRKKNLDKAFPWAKWDWSTAKILIEGKYKDRPQFSVEGHYRHRKLLYRTKSPGGGPSSMKIFDRKGKLLYNYNPAPAIESEKIKEYTIHI